MSGESIFTGKSVDEAIAEGLRALGLTADTAEIEVISRGSRGIFGLGSEPAQVRITRRRPASPSVAKPAAVTPPAVTPPAITPPAVTPAIAAEDEAAVEAEDAEASFIEPPTAAISAPTATRTDKPASEDDAESSEAPSTPEEDAQLAALATEFLNKLVELMGFEADVIAEWRESDADNEHRYLLLDLQGRDLSPLIGRRGDTLSNMQYLVRLMINQRLHRWKNIVVDVEGYRQRRIEHLSQLALRSAQQVAQSGRPFSLEPMPASERRIIHLALRDHAEVYTESIGEGTRRKVQILPHQ
ncbi:MAG: Jag N-terminal domain-containing protein [Anaerolineales bacterium]|nr:Jag N-terminal domain-containing protein [Anaerolineales bacterium]